MVIKVDAPFLSLAHIIASLIPKWVLKKFLVCTLDYNLQQPFIIIEGNKTDKMIISIAAFLLFRRSQYVNNLNVLISPDF